MNRGATSLFARIPADDGLQEEIVMFDVEGDGRIIDRQHAGTSAYSEVIPHPDGDTLGWASGIGGYHASTYWSARDGDRLSVRSLGTSAEWLADIHPAGHEYLTVDMAGEMRARRFLTDSVIGRLPAEEETGWDDDAKYLGQNAVIGRRGRSFLLHCSPLSVASDIAYPPGSEPEHLFTTIHSAWFTSGKRRFVRWTLETKPSYAAD
jgi:hypothetical protein